MDFVITHRGKLRKKYGKESANRLIGCIKKLVGVKNGALMLIDKYKGKEEKFDFKEQVIPKRLKICFDEIDQTTDEENNFLIIGGDSIIPFFRVKNPTNDQDKKIITDAPYASRDNDFLIPQTSFGRISDSAEKDVEFLTQIIEQARKHYNGSEGNKESFGYTASVWKKASKSVYSVVGDVKNLKISPPLDAKKLKKNWFKKKYLYFNLHGSNQTPNWYGQRAQGDEPDFPLYPIALTPEKIPSLKGSCVYTEACYGAWIFDKSKEESLALTFLSQGAIAFVGSTAIAYGPPAPPSTEADLLGHYFLKNVKMGIPFGIALRNAKVDFAKTMIKKQGFLDGDDKKTLLEFQLYGDPSLGFTKK